MEKILVYGLSPDHIGGIETYMMYMDSALKGLLHFDYVLEGGFSKHGFLDNESILKYYVPGKRTPIKNIDSWKKILKDNRKEYNIIYFNLFSLAWMAPLFIALRYHYKVVVHAHNNNLHNCGFIQRLFHFFGRIVQRFLRITRLTNSSLSSRFFFGKCESTQINCAIDMKRFLFQKQIRDDYRNKIGVASNEHLYGFVGRLSYQKNPLFLIDVFKNIFALDSKAKFIICGEGELESKIREKVKQYNINVFFAGPVINIEDYYFAMDVFILPSKFEGLGIVLIEAQTSGLPCLTSSGVVPIDSKITNHIHYIPLSNNASEWAVKAVEAIHEVPDRRLSFEQAIKSNFNVDIEAKKLKKVLIGQ